jgi:DNA repair protein RadA/Sms
MLLAVLEKRAGLRSGNRDVSLNITGGIRVDDPATDLAVVSAVLSSAEDIPIPQKSCFAGEVGLSGEVRVINRIEQRWLKLNEWVYERIFIPRHAARSIRQQGRGIELIPVASVHENFLPSFWLRRIPFIDRLGIQNKLIFKIKFPCYLLGFAE